jgi:glycogen debranching enzyme
MVIGMAVLLAGLLGWYLLPASIQAAAMAPAPGSLNTLLWQSRGLDILVQVVLIFSGVLGLLGLLAETKAPLDGSAVEEIVAAYAKGTRYGIRADRDGLLAAGEPGLALTWMDAVVGGRAVTPRIGKPVEVQALWINALKIAGSASPSWGDLRDRALASFRERFWNESESALYDVVDCEHVPGRDDASFRPNQILSVGGLPFAVLSGRRAVAVVESVERRLLTPVGLRTLAPDDARYAGRYAGDARERDASYHQGTVWPWLLGPFCEAWVRIRGGGAAVRREARRLFLEPLLARVGEPGTGHLPELYDGDEPHAPGCCPFQAWSLAEALRLDRDVLAERRPGRGRREASAEREIGA